MLRSSNDWPPFVTHMRRRAGRCRRLRRQQAVRGGAKVRPPAGGAGSSALDVNG